MSDYDSKRLRERIGLLKANLLIDEALMPNCAAFVRGTMENLERYYSVAPRPKVVEFAPQSFF